MLLLIRLFIILELAGLNFLRGWKYRPLCIALMSISMGLYWAIYLHIWWMLFLVGVPMGICLGLKDHNRGVWCSLVACGASVFLLFFGHINLIEFILYCGFNYFLGWLMVNKLKATQFWADLITGAGFGLIVL